MKKPAVGLVLALLAAAAVGSSLPAAAAGDAQATHVADPCDVPADPSKDLADVSFGYNAQAFQVGVDLCRRLLGPNGDWLITFHLTSFSPEVQVSGLLQDVGRYETWSGFRVCAAASCPVDADPNAGGPAGSRLDDIGFGYVPLDDNCWNGDPDCVPAAEQPPTSPFAYGAWAQHLPGTSLPASITWWAEVRQRTAPDTFGAQLDRAPQVGTATSAQLPDGRPTTITVTPGPAPTWSAGISGAQRFDAGFLRTDGSPLGDRLVTIAPGARPDHHRERSGGDGAWQTSYVLPGNAVARATFPGDGVHAAGTSPLYHAYVRAFVSLDLPAQVRLGSPVELRGVVRPRGVRGVEVLVKPDAPGYAWTLLRTAPLVAGRTDTYYRVPWTPRARGRYVLVTRWRYGTTDDGGVLNGQSAYRRVTVG